MSDYLVEIQYQKGPALSMNVMANTAKEANEKAARLAKQSGFDMPIKKFITKLLVPDEASELRQKHNNKL
jgi:hypothetical protein